MTTFVVVATVLTAVQVPTAHVPAPGGAYHFVKCVLDQTYYLGPLASPGTRLWWRSDDCDRLRGWSFGAWELCDRTCVRNTEHLRIERDDRRCPLTGRLTATGISVIAYLGRRSTAGGEIEFGRGRVRFAGRFSYFPFEGLRVGLGYDSDHPLPVFDVSASFDEWSDAAWALKFQPSRLLADHELRNLTLAGLLR